MKRGDLVNWHTDAWVFKAAEKDYKCPGIVLNVNERYYKNIANCSTPRITAEVLWSDMRVTTEHACYLRIVE